MVQVLERSPSASKDRVKPKRLSKADTIGIVSPGRWMSEADLKSTSARLLSLGYRPRLHEQNFMKLHQLAGSDSERAAAVNSVLCDPNLKAVMFSKSGYGTLRILDHLDYESIAQAPKLVIGYSDATALLIALRNRSNLVTYHGPMLYDLVSGIDNDTWIWFESILVNGEQVPKSCEALMNATILRSGIAEGELVDGNLTLLTNLLGTSSDFHTDGRILFFEDDDEHLYAIDRMMVHLKRSGKLSKLAGLIVGQMTDISDDKIPFGYDVNEIVLQHCAGTDYPIVSGFPFGHGGKQLTMPIGIRSRLEASADSPLQFTFLESPVS